MARSFFLPPRHPMPHLIESSSQGLVCERVLSPYLPPRRGDHATVRPLLAAIGAVDARVAGIVGVRARIRDRKTGGRRQGLTRTGLRYVTVGTYRAARFRSPGKMS